MSILSSLSTAVSGLQAQSDAIGHISDNLSNAQTTGYKEVNTKFRNLVTNSSARSHSPGATLADPAFRNSEQGDVTQSTISTHAALSGSGFFRVSEAEQVQQNNVTFEDEARYTRRGDFEVDRQGFLKNGANHYLQGKRVLDQETRQTADQLEEINISQGGLGLAPQRTSEIAYNANLPGDVEKASASDFFTTDTDGRAQVSEVSFGNSGPVAAGDRFSLQVDGNEFAYVAGGGESAGAIASYFEQAINTGNVTDTPGRMVLPDDPGNFGTNPNDYPDVTAELVPGDPGTVKLTASTIEGSGINQPGADFDLDVERTEDPVGAVAQSELTQEFNNAAAGGGSPGANESYSITVAGRTVSYTTDGSEADVEEVIGYITDAINGFNPAPSPPGNLSGVGAIEGVTATQTGTNNRQIRLESNEAGNPIGDINAEDPDPANDVNLVEDERLSNAITDPTQADQIYTLTIENKTVAYKTGGSADTAAEVAQNLVDAANDATNTIQTGLGSSGNGVYYALEGTDSLVNQTDADDITTGDGGSQPGYATKSSTADTIWMGNNSGGEISSARITGPAGNLRFQDTNDNRAGNAVFANTSETQESVAVGTAATRELGNIGSLDINTAIRTGDGFQTGEDFDSSEDYYTTESNFLENTVSGGSTTLYDEAGNEYDMQFRWMYRGKDPISGEDQWQMYYKDPAFQNDGGVGVDGDNGNGNQHWVPALGFEGATFQKGTLTSNPDFQGNRSITFTQGDRDPLEISSFSFRNPDDTLGLTNYSDSQTSVTRLEQNGFQAGSVTDIRIDDEGFVTSEFDNGEERALYEVTVGVFSDANALQRRDGAAYTATNQSGEPRIESQGRNGAGDISGGTLEESTVSISESFTDMIEAQRIYSANTRVVTTADEMTQQTLQLK